MPTYQYSCTDCGEPLEVVQKFTDDALTVCPLCQGKLRKVYSGVGIVFKGSGFYRTDSRSGSGDATIPPADAAKSDKPEKAASAPAASSGDSAPAKTPAPAATPAKSTPAPSSSAPSGSGAGSKAAAS